MPCWLWSRFWTVESVALKKKKSVIYIYKYKTHTHTHTFASDFLLFRYCPRNNFTGSHNSICNSTEMSHWINHLILYVSSFFSNDWYCPKQHRRGQSGKRREAYVEINIFGNICMHYSANCIEPRREALSVKCNYTCSVKALSMYSWTNVYFHQVWFQ